MHYRERAGPPYSDRCRGGVSNIKFVWSPRGEVGLHFYYPGLFYADYVGISLFDLEPSGARNSVAKLLRKKYERVQAFDLPIIVTEVGVEGEPDQQRSALVELKSVFPELPMLMAVTYFNALEPPGVWPPPYRPDWRIARRQLATIAAR